MIRSLAIVHLLLLLGSPVLAQWGAADGPRNLPRQVQSLFSGRPEATVKGDIGMALPGKKVVVSGDDGTAIVAELNKNLPQQLQGLPLDFTFRKGSGNQVSLTDVAPHVVTTWHKSGLAKTAFNVTMAPKLAEVDKSIKELDARFQGYVQSDHTTASDFVNIVATNDQVKTALRQTYATTPRSETQLLNQLARLLTEANDFERHAQIGHDDNYWPEVYEKMHRHSRSAAAIALIGSNTATASGALIGENLILTCNHVFHEAVEDYEVWFDFERTNSGPLTKKVFPIDSVIFRGKSAPGLGGSILDFALIKIGRDRDGNKSCEELGYKPLPLSTVVCHEHDPIYIIGHPKGDERKIHDNVRVHFPHKLSENRKIDLDSRVRTEISNEVNRLSTLSENDRNLKIEQEYAKYEASFLKVGTSYRYINQVLRVPAMGVDSDTYSGSSGAPACLRRPNNKTDGIVGVYIGGNGGGESASWLRHQIVLPTTEIIEQIKAELPTWTTDFKVTVNSPASPTPP